MSNNFPMASTWNKFHFFSSLTPDLSRGLTQEETANSFAVSKLPISVHILAFNSAKTLSQALASVKDAAEILVIDGGSTDATIEIAKNAGAMVIPQREAAAQGTPLTDFSAARNIGLKHATQPWILSLDSDEYASPELMEGIKMAIASGKPYACYVPRRYVLENGNMIDYATTYPNKRLYFFHRDLVKQWIKPVHERPDLLEGTTIKHMKGASLAPLGTIEDYIEKNTRYLAIEKKKSEHESFAHWFQHRFLRTVRSRLIALIKLIWIWGIPRPGRRLPLKHELIRFWYAWHLLIETFPRHHSNPQPPTPSSDLT